jgi:hypothetical protein
MNDTGFERHVRACNNAVLPGARLPFLIGDQPVGWVSPDMVAALRDMPSVRCAEHCVTLEDPVALPGIAKDLSERGLYHWRGEAFDVRAQPGGAVLSQIDRGAIPVFGIQAVGIHVNGIVRRGEELHLWVARRARSKLLDPGKLDHIVAGGVPAGLGPDETLAKEAGEEASIPPVLAHSAVAVGAIDYVMERPEGLRRDLLFCYDLLLPDDFNPTAADGEVEGFELWPIQQVVQTVRDTDDFKFNVNLVLIDLFIRHGLVNRSEAESIRAIL